LGLVHQRLGIQLGQIWIKVIIGAGALSLSIDQLTMEYGRNFVKANQVLSKGANDRSVSGKRQPFLIE
jgi:hypothetical protein